VLKLLITNCSRVLDYDVKKKPKDHVNFSAPLYVEINRLSFRMLPFIDGCGLIYSLFSGTSLINERIIQPTRTVIFQ